MFIVANTKPATEAVRLPMHTAYSMRSILMLPFHFPLLLKAKKNINQLQRKKRENKTKTNVMPLIILCEISHCYTVSYRCVLAGACCSSLSETCNCLQNSIIAPPYNYPLFRSSAGQSNFLRNSPYIDVHENFSTLSVSRCRKDKNESRNNAGY